MSPVKWLNIGLRGLMETGIVLGLGYWGYQTGEGTIWKIILAVGAPLVGFGFWGLVDFHRLGKTAEPLRLIQELTISGLTAIALYSAGAHIAGWFMGILSVVQHAMTYMAGEKLLKEKAGHE